MIQYYILNTILYNTSTMSSLIEIQKTYFFNSSPILGAFNRSADGSKFEVLLSKEIVVPPTAVDCTIECRSANIWFTSPNIAAEYNNNILYLTYNGVDFEIIIPDGLYNVVELNSTVQRIISDLYIPLGGGVFDVFRFKPNTISFGAIRSQQRVLLRMNAGLEFRTDSNLINSVASVLGFTSTPGSPPLIATYDGDFFEAENVARLNRINSYLLHADIANEGLSVNNSYSNILTEIQLNNLGIGELLIYNPFLPYKLNGNHLKYGSKSLLAFRLTNELNEPIDTFGEDYSFSMTISYRIESHTSMIDTAIPTFKHY
jgi:hypothetical protein